MKFCLIREIQLFYPNKKLKCKVFQLLYPNRLLGNFVFFYSSFKLYTPLDEISMLL